MSASFDQQPTVGVVVIEADGSVEMNATDRDE